MGNAGEPVDFNNEGNLGHGNYVGVPPGFGNTIPPQPKKSNLMAYLLALPPLGLFGGHHFYLGRPEFGVMYFFTLGLFGVGWIIDLCRMPLLVAHVNEERYDYHMQKKKTSLDAYHLWANPVGLFGFHHYYLGRWTWGIAYTFTIGLGGVGWICDGFRIHFMVKESNDRKLRQLRPVQDPNELLAEEERMTLPDAYVLGISPFGFVGAHHYYMGRFFVGIVYTFSLGLLGIGWIADLVNMPVIFRRAKRIRLHGDDGVYYLDDAFRLLWPFGFLGLHYFYLRHPGRGVLYLFTLGLLGVGWIVDFFRLPKLVKDANKKVREERAHLDEIRDRLGPNARIVGDQRTYVAYATRDAYGSLVLPSPTTIGEQQPPRSQAANCNLSESLPPPYPGSTAPGIAQAPPRYQSAVITTISEDDENSFNEVMSSSLTTGATNRAFHVDKH